MSEASDRIKKLAKCLFRSMNMSFELGEIILVLTSNLVLILELAGKFKFSTFKIIKLLLIFEKIISV